MNNKSIKSVLTIALVVLLVLTSGFNYSVGAEKKQSGQLSAEQKNSIAMLNYLTVLTTEINESKNSRLYLENAYSTLINCTNPEAVDVKTQTRLDNLLDTIESFRMVDVKRDRLQYIYKQNQAKAIRSAIPNPLGLLSATNSMSLSGIVASGLYMTVDSVTSYKSAKQDLDMKYLEDGWALDDQEAADVHNMRKKSFNYMIEIVRDNKLPGNLALSEENVDDFVEWEKLESTERKIHFLESSEETYKAFGGYWLALAKAYYDNKEYNKCLKCVSKYEQMDIRIFREDHEYADVLPVAIAALSEQYNAKKINRSDYVKKADRFVNALLKNADKDDWNLRYFTAQSCVELAAVTKDSKYLKKAYDIVLENANHLVESQRADNAAYMAELEEKEIPDGASKQEKKDIKQYNKLMKEDRKVALPPVNEALALNCDLLYSLADKRGISKKEKKKIDSILHESGEKLFLVQPIDDTYRFEKAKADNLKTEIEFEKDQILIPAVYVDDDAVITVNVQENGKTTTYKDWSVKKVKREDEEDVNSFMAYFEGDKIKKQDFSEKTKVQLIIDPKPNSNCKKIEKNFKVDNYSHILFLDRISFSEDK